MEGGGDTGGLEGTTSSSGLDPGAGEGAASGCRRSRPPSGFSCKVLWPLKALEERSRDQFPLKAGKLGRADSPPWTPTAAVPCLHCERPGTSPSPPCPTARPSPAPSRPRPAPTRPGPAHCPPPTPSLRLSPAQYQPRPHHSLSRVRLLLA